MGKRKETGRERKTEERDRKKQGEGRDDRNSNELRGRELEKKKI